MATKSVQITIEGMSPLLMHKYPLVPSVTPIEKLEPAEQAELAAYRLDGPTSNLCIPGQALQRAFIAGATFSKGKGRGSLQKQVAACVLVVQDNVDLQRSQYVIDSRPVTIPATRGRIVRHRPRLDEWRGTFDVEYDPDLLTGDQLRQVADDTGLRVGLLDFRPERKGPFGRFRVIRWDR